MNSFFHYTSFIFFCELYQKIKDLQPLAVKNGRRENPPLLGGGD